MGKKTLNLGAGNRISGKAVNHDLCRHRDEIDVVWDLNDLPWPWDENEFSDVVAWAVLEHLSINLLTAMDEIHRIMKPGGTLMIKLPRWDVEESYNDPTHRYTVGKGIFDVFDPSTKRGGDFGFYTMRKWRIVEVKETLTCVVGTLRSR